MVSSTTGATGAVASPNKMGRKLQASATTALTALLGWQNHRSTVERSISQMQHRSPQQQHQQHYHHDDRSQNESSYHSASMASNHRQQQQHHHHHPHHHITKNTMDSNGYAREHYMQYPIGASSSSQSPRKHPQLQNEDGPIFTDDEGAATAGNNYRGVDKAFTVSSKKVQLAPMSEEQPPQAAML